MTDISKLEPNDTTKIAMLECEIERLRWALYRIAARSATESPQEIANRALLSRQ